MLDDMHATRIVDSGAIGPDLGQSDREHDRAIERYYRSQAPLYDATRWAFLFGRDELLGWTALENRPERILEVGCGTGRNLSALARLFPRSRITGLDLSWSMLRCARKKNASYRSRVELLRLPYDRPIRETPSFDLVLFSYSLSMFNGGFDRALDAATRDLKPNGFVAVVDFLETESPRFLRWLQMHRVTADGGLRRQLHRRFARTYSEERDAYGGLWRSILFLGQPRPIEAR